MTAHRAAKTNTLPIAAISSFGSGAAEKTQMMHEDLFHSIRLHSLKLGVSLIIIMLHMQSRCGGSVSGSRDQKVHQDVLFCVFVVVGLNVVKLPNQM